MKSLNFRRQKPNFIDLADAARDTQQWETATLYYRRELRKNPDNYSIWIQYGHALKESGQLKDPKKLAQAENAYIRAITHQPTVADWHLQLGHVLKLQGLADRAEAAYRQALALDASLTYAAQELAALGVHDLSSPPPVQHRPDTVAANGADPLGSGFGRRTRRSNLIWRADLERDLGNWKAAAELYQRALARDPTNAPIWARYAQAQQEAGRVDEAESAYVCAINQAPTVASWHLQLGHVLKLQGRIPEAQAAYFRALTFAPSMRQVISEFRELGWSPAELFELKELVRAETNDDQIVSVAVEEQIPGSRVAELTNETSTSVAPNETPGVATLPHIARDPRCDQTTTQWLSPSYIEIDFLQGAVRRKLACDGAVWQPAEIIDVQVPESRAAALVCPLVLFGPYLLELRLGSLKVPAGANIHYALYARLDGSPLSEGIAHLSRGDDNWCNGLLRTRCFVANGRHFLRIWCHNEVGAASVEMLVCRFSSDFFWNRQLSEIGFHAQYTLPDQVLLRPTHKYRIGILSGGNSAGLDAFVHSMRVGYPNDTVELRNFSGSYTEFLDWVSSLHFCVLFKIASIREFGISTPEFAAALNRHGVCTVYVGEVEDGTSSAAAETANVCHFHIQWESGASLGGINWRAHRGLPATERGYPSLRGLRARFWPGERLPSVAIISIHYNKPHIVENFLTAIYRQTYPGEISVVMIDDCSAIEAYTTAVEVFKQQATRQPARMSIELKRNDENLGNCMSRNRGLSETAADIFIVIDADCLINKDFVAAHVRGHLYDTADVVIGPLNLETAGRPALPMLAELEEDQDQVLSTMNMQDDIQLNGFVNCITRNLSFSRALKERLWFDTQFGYRADMASGYGWEDVDFGYRLYRAGARIKFTTDAFSLHQSHASTVSESRQIVGSARNYNKLFDKNAELMHIARRWSTDTAEKILAWSQRAGVTHPELGRLSERFMKNRLEIRPFLSTWRTGQRRLRIVTHRWHVPHQYEIYKLPHDFTLLTGTGTGFTDHWEYSQRPLRPNVRLRSMTEFDPRDYDLAIIHFDENVLCSDLTNGILGVDWGHTFQWFLRNTKDIPTVAVCHGTPMFIGQFGANPERIEQFEVIEDERQRLVDATRHIEVVCNSHQAAQEWQFERQRVIWHGIDPQEFPPGTHELNVVSHGLDCVRPHYRGLHDLERIMNLLGPEIAVASHKHDSVKLVPMTDPSYSDRSYRAWIDHLRRYKVYLNTTLRSPMPRSRTEAMMCGVIPICMRNHDVDHFIINGVNGFYGDSAEELADAVRFVLSNDAARATLARAARETAAQTFNHDRFLSEWTSLLQSLGE